MHALTATIGAEVDSINLAKPLTSGDAVLHKEIPLGVVLLYIALVQNDCDALRNGQNQKI